MRVEARAPLGWQRRWNARTGAVAAAAGLAALLYLSTLMTTISGCVVEYCYDTGELQVALPLWGTVHHTGYPLYMLMGSPFVTVARWLGVPPAAGASLFSLVWAVAGVAGLVGLALRLKAPPLPALAAGLLFAAFEPIWVHGSLPEVYSLSVAFMVVILWLVVRLRNRWSFREGLLLALAAGLAVAHHRLLAVMLPLVGLYVLPGALRSRQFWRWLPLAALCFVLGFLPYLDMPLRAWRGTGWNYGQPDTWDGFWHIFWGREVSGLQEPLTTWPELRGAAVLVLQRLRYALSWPGLVVCALGIAAALAVRRPRGVTWLLGGISVGYLAFAVIYPRAVMIEAVLMGVLFCGALLVATGLGGLPQPYQTVGVAGVLIAAGWLATRNWPRIEALTRDTSAIKYQALLDGLEAPPGSVVMAPWGMHFFALTYGQRVDGRWPNWQFVDHRADMRALAAAHGRIYTPADTAYVFNREWWAPRLGEPLRATSAGPGLVALSAEPLAPPTAAFLALGDGIGLTDWDIAAEGNTLRVTLYWSCTRVPSQGYSTFVHATDQAEITKPDDLLAQSDSAAPVYGWQPTTLWQPAEVVREDHMLSLPDDRTATTIFVGMYAPDEAGQLVQLGRLRFRQTAEAAWHYDP